VPLGVAAGLGCGLAIAHKKARETIALADDDAVKVGEGSGMQKHQICFSFLGGAVDVALQARK
jgi:hypothetical protein